MESAPAGLAAEVASTAWYHTLELPGGVVTPGWYDLRSARPRVPLPPLAGKRCLDVGSATGYWAFEMERLGAAEVVSLDLEDQGASDWPGAPAEAPDAPQGLAGTGFEIARRRLGSQVRRVDGSVYDLDPDQIGRFDFVFMGSLLLHLSDPVGALRRIHGVCAGELLSLEVVAPLLSLVPLPVAALTRLASQQWWIPNRRCHRQLIRSAGFDVAAHGGLVRQRFGEGFPRVTLRTARSLWALRVLLVEQRLGVPSQWVLARPR